MSEYLENEVEYYYDPIPCSECGYNVCGTCGCCHNPDCNMCSCPSIYKEE